MKKALVLSLWLPCLAPAIVFGQAHPAEGGGCPAASAKLDMATAGSDPGHLSAHGTWSVAGGALGAYIEYRIDGDRWAAQLHMGADGSWDVSIPFTTCARHALRATAMPIVKDGERELVCIARSASDLEAVMVPCGAAPELGECEWKCGEGDGAACTGVCPVSVSGGEGDYVPMWQSGIEGIKDGGEASPGPWKLQVTCKRGDKVLFRVRSSKQVRGYYSTPVNAVCGGGPAPKP